MATKRSKSRRCIQVIEGEVLTAAGRLWKQTRASFAQAALATLVMQHTARIPDPSTRLIN